MKCTSGLLLIYLALLFGCGNTTSTEESTQNETANQTLRITAKAIENFRYDDYTLSNDAKKEVSNWAKYQELSTQVDFLKQADITFFTSPKDTLKAFLDSLKINIPDNLNTNPINARVAVLETKLLKLNDDLTLDNYSKENKLESIKAFLISNSNLIFLINKKLEFDKNDISRPE